MKMGEIMLTKTAYEKSLDCRDEPCADVLAKVRSTIDNMKSGEVLEVLTTDECSGFDLPTWVKRSGNDLLLSENVRVFHIRKG
jgi:TusA-related sulfurtransferase